MQSNFICFSFLSVYHIHKSIIGMKRDNLKKPLQVIQVNHRNIHLLDLSLSKP
eukprot:c33881_g1_i1 orf=85-243(+)